MRFIFTGIVFGFILIKAEVISWFRIQEMFRFQSFHMYGIIGSAVAIGVISILLIKKFNLKSFNKEAIDLSLDKPQFKNTLFGGIIFGLGWALVGACPGPFYALLGAGNIIYLIPIVSLILGVVAYGALKNKLPH